ncbi:3-oxoacyl-[acyl-carrier protein] reductase [Salegentibacter salegens]|nr:3-oxoacyl-[acyl-carrier protein] reductase [Salegentibacter salegens]
MKYALITGASRGIGKAIALKIAKELQYNILLNYHSNTDAAEATKKLIEAEGVKCELLQFDVADAEKTAKAFEDFGKNNLNAEIEVIVNNAGITRDGLFMWMKPEDWQS